MTEYVIVTKIESTFYSMVDQRSAKADRSFPTTDQEARITIGQCMLTID